jgi:hypothetical protein
LPGFLRTAGRAEPGRAFSSGDGVFARRQLLQRRFTRQQSLAIPFDLPAKLRTCLPDFTDAKRTEIVALSRLENRDSLPRLVDMLFAKQINAASL